MWSAKIAYPVIGLGVASVAVAGYVAWRGIDSFSPAAQIAPSALLGPEASNRSTASPTVAGGSGAQPFLPAPAIGSPTADDATIATPQPAAGETARLSSREPLLNPPAFDVIRVEPTGETVVAGHSAPNAAVKLLDEGRAIAEAQADDAGLFVILPPPLGSGTHHLTLAARSGDVQAPDSEATTIEVSDSGKKQPPGGAPQAAAALSSSEAKLATEAPIAQQELAAPPAGKPVAPAEQDRVSILSVEATESGRLEVKGFARANTTVRLYLNGSFVADVNVGPEGRWSLTVEHGMTAGRYAIRADEIKASDGLVLARAEVPFAYPASVSANDSSLNRAALPALHAAGAVRPVGGTPPIARDSINPPQMPVKPIVEPVQAPAAAQSAISESPALRASNPLRVAAASEGPALPVATAEAFAPSTAAPDVVVPDIRTATVVRGDSLWRLSRRYYRDGMRYRQIYSANASQIRNPGLIYPGQIFVVPKEPGAGATINPRS